VEEDCRAVVVFDGSAPSVDVGDAPVEVVSTGEESADDWIAREAPAQNEPYWLVTSDRELRTRSESAERIIGGGAFARTLLQLR
jgi:hypothetical protein